MKSSFEDAIAELVGHLVRADPIDQELVMLKLRHAIADAQVPTLRTVSEPGDECFDNVPI